MVDYKGILQVLESWELVSYLEKKRTPAATHPLLLNITFTYANVVRMMCKFVRNCVKWSTAVNHAFQNFKMQ